MRAFTAIALAALLALGLSACGSKDTGSTTSASKQDYCAAVRKLAGKHRPAPQRLANLVQDAGNVATGEIAADWHDISVAVLAYAASTKRALRDPAHPPYGLNAAQTRALNRRILAAAYRTNVAPVSRQVQAVRRQIRSDCGVGTTL
ncbi:MAG TPA: hypothetical protein VJ872_13370 [Nocardioides sp.]|nr:hypothetical protein [Nocardioides sp.]